MASYGTTLLHMGSLRTIVTSVKSENTTTQSNRLNKSQPIGQIETCLLDKRQHTDSPAEDAKDEVEHEKGANDDEGDEENPVESVPKCIVGLQLNRLQ